MKYKQRVAGDGVGPGPTAVETRTAATRIPGRLLLGAVIAATFIAYAPAMKGPFVFDDKVSIVENRSIQRLWPLTIPLRPPENTSVSGRPVVNYSLAANYALNEWLGIDQRPDPEGPFKTAGYHVANVLLHIACGLLLFGIVRRTLSRGRVPIEWAAIADPFAAVVTGLWLLHPIQTEAVHYLIQRTELMVSAFYLATLYASIRSLDATSRRSVAGWCSAAIAFCLLGMGSKEVMIFAPVMVMLYDRAFRFSSWREMIRSPSRRVLYGGLVATLGLAVALIARGSRLSASVGFHLGITPLEYAYSQAWAIGHYLRLVFWPSGLTLDYGKDPISGLAPLPGLVLLVTFGVATVLAWLRADRWGWFGFIGAWFFLILAPSSSFVPISTEIAAERRIYLALASVLVLVVIGCEILRRRLVMRAKRWSQWLARTGWVWIFAGALGALGASTFERSRTYTDPEALWRDAIAKVPANPRAYDNLANLYRRQRPPRTAEAEALLRQAVALDSTYLNGWDVLAEIAIEKGHTDEAIALLEHALRIDSTYVDAGERLGNLLVQEGQADRAIPILERVAAHSPSDEAWVALATAYAVTGRTEQATHALRRAIELNPLRADAMRYLGASLIEQGRASDAVPYLEEAVQRDPVSAQGFALLSLSYGAAGRATDAIRAGGAALSKTGTDPEVYVVVGRAMVLIGRRDQGGELFRHALEVAPGYPPAKQALSQLTGRK